MSIDVGHVVGGKYELVRLLGRGSMGEVWSAHHVSLGEKLALKLLMQGTSSTRGQELESASNAAARFQFEAQVAARLSRKTRHIVRVSDHGEEDGLAYLVMEQLEGETLESVLVREGRVPLATVNQIVAQVSRALAFAHAEGVLHRDLKPANLFLTRDEEGKLLVKLLDFGIARAIHAHRVTSAFSTEKGLVFGTPGYMSPEQARASSRLDHQCDLWALATIAYEALSGELPVEGRDSDEVLKNLCAGRMVPLRERMPEVPSVLQAFFLRAFSDAIGARFPSATDLAKAFARAAAHGEPAAKPATSSPPPSMPPGMPSVPPPALVPAAAVVTKVEPASEAPPPLVAPARSLREGPPTRARRVRAVAVAGGGALLLLLGVGVAWRVLAQAAPVPAASAAGLQPAMPSAPPAVALPADPPAAAQVSDVPAVAFSALPRPRGRPPGAVSAAPPVNVPNVAPAPVPLPAPAPAPGPTSRPRKLDKSEVL